MVPAQPRQLTRRQALTAGAAGLVLGPIAGQGLAHGEPQDEFATLAARWRDYLTGGPGVDPAVPLIRDRLAELDAEITRHLATLAVPASGSTGSLWADLPLAGTNREKSNSMRDSFARLATLARGYATAGSSHRADAALAGRVVEAMRWLNETMFAHGVEYESGAWYEWEISTPDRVINAAILLGEALPAEDRTALLASIDRWTPDPSKINYNGSTATGANLVWKCRQGAVSGVLGRDGERLAKAGRSVTAVFPYVTAGDGFYRDGSFIQHEAFPYNGAYGSGLVITLAPLLGLLAGTSWEISDPQKGNLAEWVYQSFEPFMINGAMMDLVRGRVISDQAESDHVAGHKIIELVLRAAAAAPETDSAAFRAMAKTWITRDTYLDFLARAPLPLLPPALAVLSDDGLQLRERPPGFRAFPAMDRALQHARGYSVGLALSSSRIRNFEATNLNTNMHGWYTANGMVYVYTDDLGHYADDHWPTVDPYRLPGTTVDRVPRADSQGRNYTSPDPAVGAIGLDGYGSASMALVQDPRYGSTLRAKKSWFFLDDRVVALGADITAGGSSTVETTIENRNLHAAGTETFTVDGVRQPAEPGEPRTFGAPRWAHLAGTGGYLFLDGAELRTVREDRTGRWRDIHVNGSTEPTRRRYQTLWLDHGPAPAAASYAYALLPGASARRTAELADDPGLRVMINNGRAQAVQAPARGFTAVNFWTPGRVGPITLETPSAADLPTVIVDDRSAGFAVHSGDWQVSTDAGGARYEGQQHYHPAGDGSAVVRFAIKVPTSGTYELGGWWFEHSSYATNTPFVIKHAAGTQTVRLSQRWGGGSRWRRVGVFDFTAGGDHWVEINNDANGIVVADAIRLTPVTATDRWEASVIMIERRDGLALAVSDPTQLNRRITLKLDRPGRWSWQGDPEIEVAQLDNGVRLTVDVADAGGQPRQGVLRR
ncbi:polysaccharide lyase family 8 super-sandwich domain-containing protein [Microlunatus sp. GCM10028923]|uniref:polysaccharide lyase family 8 super-sandwich domain-containing protein n=1 Tax=Microlunatus sp. GCM10028923 TaxID=3273400 RepID=UPI003610C210